MRGLVDIHCHILPGIDDGPPDMVTSLAMARAAVESGISTVAATPHLRADFPDVHVQELAARCDDLRREVARAGIQIDIVSGAEVSLGWALRASDEALRLASYEQRGTDVLIETPSGPVAAFGRLLAEVQRRGYRVTLAHPERSPHLWAKHGLIDQFAAQGVVLQINAESLINAKRRSRTSSLAYHLCSSYTKVVVASDGHRGDDRRSVTALRKAADSLTASIPTRVAALTCTCPAALIRGRPILVNLPVVQHQRHQSVLRLKRDIDPI